MKRGEPLKRKKPLERGKPLDRRSELERGKPLNAQSDKRRAQAREERGTKRAALDRDRVCVAARYVGLEVAGVTVPPCWGPLDKDEIVSRARGGSATELGNVQILCRRHNGWKEDEPDAAEALGLARHSWERDA